mgnify:CR=1 FL=1
MAVVPYVSIKTIIDAGGVPTTDLEYVVGRVLSYAMPVMVMPIDQFEALIVKKFSVFIGLVTHGNPTLTAQVVTESPCKLEYMKKNNGHLHLETHIGNIVSDHDYDPVTKLVTADRPQAFDVSWGAYLLWKDAIETFIRMARLIDGP